MMSAMSLAVIALATLAVAPVTSVSHDDAVHVGCFKTNLVDTQRSYYMVDDLLSWENGISACIHRYTTHVGVQADNSTSSLSYFFCGNDLLEHSDKLEDSDCVPCEDPADRHCGGPQSLSVYRIRDSTPLVIFVAAAEKGIRLLEVDGSHTMYSSPIQTPTNAVRIETAYSKDEILFQTYSGFKLYKSFYGHQIQEYITPSKVLEVPDKSYLLGFTYDWLNNELYYCEDRQIVKYEMTSEIKRLRLPTDSGCYDLAIDPYSRTLFTVYQNGSLHAYALITEKHRIYQGGEYGLQNVLRVAVDYQNQLIYVIAGLSLRDETLNHIVKLNYKDTALNILYTGRKVQTPFGLDVFHGFVIWNMWYNNTNSRIYKCRPSPKCNRENTEVLYSTTDAIKDIAIYHPLKQAPTENYLCNVMGCSHKCSRVTLFTAKCKCPKGLVLGSDNATCQEVDEVIAKGDEEEDLSASRFATYISFRNCSESKNKNINLLTISDTIYEGGSEK